jgi:hypothetical protein
VHDEPIAAAVDERQRLQALERIIGRGVREHRPQQRARHASHGSGGIERSACYRIANVGEVHAREGSDDHRDGLALKTAVRPFRHRRGCKS